MSRKLSRAQRVGQDAHFNQFPQRIDPVVDLEPMGNSSSCIVQRLSRSTACDQIGSYFHKMPESYFPAKYEFILCILVQVHHLHCPAVVVKSQHTVLTAKNQEGVDILAEHSTTA